VSEASGPLRASSLASEIAAWLETIAVSHAGASTGVSRSTIIPTIARPSGEGQRALELLEQLSAMSPTASAQLRHGATIGEGGMGIVRMAEQVALGRMVAIKTLKPSRRREPGAALDLLREAWVTGSLEHPNVVPVHYLGLDEAGHPLIVLKRIEGVDWSELVTDAAAVEARFGATDLLAWNLEILLHVLNAVRFAHSRGIVHRDLKPSNVMIGEFGEVYLLDWGLAVSLRDDGSGRLPLATHAVELAGTPCYMAPEMLGAERGVPLSERTDVYLAGAVLYELITGDPPHLGASAAEIIDKVATSSPTLPSGVPAELGRICQRAMALDPADRYQSIDELRRALQHYLGHRGSARLAERAQVRLDELLGVLADDLAPAAERSERVHRLFGACRFGFHEALVAWRDNDDARAGLERATVAVAEHELRADDPRAALGLLHELDPPPAELLARARAAATERDRREAEREQVRLLHDPRIGTRTRMFLAVVLGAVFTVAPLVPGVLGASTPGGHSYRMLFVSSLILLGLVGVLGAWGRESMLATRVNQRALLMTVYLFVAQTGLVGALWHLGMPLVVAELMMLFLWAVITAAIAIGIDSGLAPAAVGNAIGFAVAVRWPDYRFYVMSAVNLIFTINAFVRWRPTQLLSPRLRRHFLKA